MKLIKILLALYSIAFLSLNCADQYKETIGKLRFENNSNATITIYTSNNFNTPVDKYEIPAGQFDSITLNSNGRFFIRKDKYLYTIEYPKNELDKIGIGQCDINTILFLAKHLSYPNLDVLTIFNDTFYPISITDADQESDVFAQKIAVNPTELFTKNLSFYSNKINGKETQLRNLIISLDGTSVRLQVPARILKKHTLNITDYREATVSVSTLSLFYKKGFTLKHTKSLAAAFAKQKARL